MGSSGTLIAGWKLKELVHQTPLNTKDGLSVYYNPIPGHRYSIVVDVSEGRSLDYSAFHVIDVSQMPYKQVCVYRNNLITPLDYAEIVHRIAIVYNHAPILVEINNMGAQVSHSLHYDFEYDNILFTENNGRNGKKISTGFGNSVDMGVRTTTPVKANGCSLLKLLIEQNQLIVNDFHTIEELARFSKKGKSYESEEGKHDDLVMGLVLFGWMTNTQFFKEITEKDYINVIKKVKKENITTENIDEIMLCQIPGISSTTAITIIEKYKSISNLIKELENNKDCMKDICYINTKGQERKINKTSIANIVKFLLKK
jgi:hypothetical protein